MSAYTIEIPGKIRVTVADHTDAAELAAAVGRTIAEQTGVGVVVFRQDGTRYCRFEVMEVQRNEVRRTR